MPGNLISLHKAHNLRHKLLCHFVVSSDLDGKGKRLEGDAAFNAFANPVECLF
jgi:hypothetical protein